MSGGFIQAQTKNTQTFSVGLWFLERLPGQSLISKTAKVSFITTSPGLEVP